MARNPRMPEEDEAWAEAPPPARRAPPRRAEAPPQETFISWRTLVIGAVAAVALAIGAVLFARSLSRDPVPDSAGAAAGDVPLVQAPAEPWRTRPDDPGGVAVEGTDRAMYDAGVGEDPIGQIAMGEVPPEPEPRQAPAPPPRDLLAQTGNPEAGDVAVLDEAAAPPVAAPPPPSASPAMAAPPRREAAPLSPRPAAPAPGATPPLRREAAARPAEAAPPAASPGGGPALQLGAFSSREAAREAWRVFSGRFAYLAGLEPAFERIEREGQTLWRLKATGTGSAERARDLCARLRVAGEDCLVVGG
jgi:hypothetical protein